MDEKAVKQLCDIVRTTSLDIHRLHRWGHLEKVYEGALGHRLTQRGLKVRRQVSLAVYDEHVAQLLGYLRSSRKEHGLLVNFGAPRLEIRQFILTERSGSIPSPCES